MRVQLAVGGKLYEGWESVRVTRSIEALCGAFELGVFDRWANQQQPWPIRPGAGCAVLLDGVPVITGQVDKRRLSVGSNGAATVRGRDATGLLVDCSCNLGQWAFRNVDLLTFAKKVCAPYGVSVRLQDGLVSSKLSAPKKMSIEPGDTAAKALENACRIAALLLVPDGLGGIVLSRAGSARCTSGITEGVNLLSGSSDIDTTQRYHTVHVLGSKPGSDEAHGSTAMARGTATDEEVDPRRVLFVRAEGPVDSEQAKTRAQWEVTVRAARSAEGSATVQGWTQADGSLWALNQLVHVRAPSLELDDDLLITGVTFERARSTGTTTTLTLRRPDAFLPMPVLRTVSGGLWSEIARGV